MPDIRSLRLGLRASPEVPWASEPSADQEEIVLIPSPSKMLLACAGLLLLSTLFYILPRKHGDGSDEAFHDANVEWYRLRQRELLLAVEPLDEIGGE